MYRLLLIAKPSDAAEQTLLRAQGYDPVHYVPDITAAVERLSQKSYDAVGTLSHADFEQLSTQLKAANINTPAFVLSYEPEQQNLILKDVRHLLHRLHVDYIDEQYSLEELSSIVQYEMLHNLLSGKANDSKKLYRWFDMLRSDIPLNLPCRVYSLGLPQGDLYLTDHWHHGQQRLQKALEMNFFSHINQIRYCAVSFISPVEARLLLVPDSAEDSDSLTDALDNAVLHTVNEIKSYLDLDIDVYQAGTAACIADITMNNIKEE